MKVQNTTIFMGDNTGSAGYGIARDKNGQASIFAGNRNEKPDLIAQRQQQAKKQIMKIVGDAWGSDRKLEDSLTESRNKLKIHKETIGEANEELKQIKAEKQALKEIYKVEEDSEEEQDLRLLEKKVDAERPGSGVRLTLEEQEQIAQIEGKGLTEYQERCLELKKRSSLNEEKIADAKKGIQEENAAISNMKEANLKSQTMIKAKEAADEIKDALKDEIIGMLIDEAKDHIDEEMEEKKETAEEKAEKEKEEQERIEKQKEKKEEKEAFTEEIADSTSSILEAEGTMGEALKEIRKIMDEMKLMEEDLKGAAVDTVK
ncbi:MAG: hypothetical protein HDQ97_05255 [Lachnospiraceae bacterium]|nr:hypothetical protein [Lachnospiraceae bacterium]